MQLPNMNNSNPRYDLERFSQLIQEQQIQSCQLLDQQYSRTRQLLDQQYTWTRHFLDQQYTQTRQLLEQQQARSNHFITQLVHGYDTNYPANLSLPSDPQPSSINSDSLTSRNLHMPPLETPSPLSTPSSIKIPSLTPGITASIIEIWRPEPSDHSSTRPLGHEPLRFKTHTGPLGQTQGSKKGKKRKPPEKNPKDYETKAAVEVNPNFNSTSLKWHLDLGDPGTSTSGKDTTIKAQP